MAFLTPPPPPSSFSLNFASQGPPPRPSQANLLPVRRRHRTLASALPNIPLIANRNVSIPDVRVEGNIKLPQCLIQKHLLSLQGSSVPRKTIFERAALVDAWYTDNGYLCSRCFVINIPNWTKKTLLFVCVEPTLTAVERIPVDDKGKRSEVESLRTTEQTIIRAASLPIGDVFQWNPSNFASLMATGIFDFLDAKVKVINDRSVHLHIFLHERPSGRIEPGAGMTSDGQIYADISVVDNNFRGRAQRLRVEWQKRIDVARAAGGIVFEDMRIGAAVPLSYRFRAYRDSNSGRGIPAGPISRHPAVAEAANAPQGFSSSLSAGDRDDLRFEKDRDGLMLDIGLRPRHSNVMLNIAPIFELIHSNVLDRERSPSIAQIAVQTSATHATRLPVDLPRFGRFARVEQLIGSCLSNPKDAFHRTTLRLSEYIGVGKRASIAMGATLGMASANLPWHEQKSLGGPSSVRGYEYGEIGRYRSYAHARVEIRIPLTRSKPTEEQSVDEEMEGNDAERGENSTETKKSSNITASQAHERTGEDKRSGEGADVEYRGNLMPTGVFDKLPALVGVVFGDIATPGVFNPDLLGASYGVGLRIGGVVAVHCSQSIDGARPSIHFGLVDRSL